MEFICQNPECPRRGEPFEVLPGKARQRGSEGPKYCSQACYRQATKGKPRRPYRQHRNRQVEQKEKPHKARRPALPTEKLCEYDQRPFKPRKDDQRYCSIECRNRAMEGQGSSSWKGGRIVRADGYIEVQVPIGTPGANRRKGGHGVGYIKEHRLVMQKKLGRPFGTLGDRPPHQRGQGG